jgi:hypothetical protein
MATPITPPEQTYYNVQGHKVKHDIREYHNARFATDVEARAFAATLDAYRIQIVTVVEVSEPVEEQQ